MGASPQRKGSGFRQTGKLLEARIRKAGETRGFAVARLLTHWEEIAGPDLAHQCRPVNVGYGRKGFGATLTVLTTGSFAPLVQAQLPRLRERVNACYGYNAITKIRVTQTAPTGFAEAQSGYAPPPTPAVNPAKRALAEAETTGIESSELRDALARLGTHILSKSSS